MIDEQFKFSGPRQSQLHARIWRAVEAKNGSVVGIHGYSEHSGRYAHFAKFLNENGFNCSFMDLPGHGLSDGERSNIEEFEDYIKSFGCFIQELRKLVLQPPIYFFGHSLGGLVLLRSLQESTGLQELGRAALFSSPLVGLASSSFHGLGRYVAKGMGEAFLRFFCRTAPNWRLDNKGDLAGNVLSHDLEIMKERMNDSLVNPVVTVHWTREFLKARKDLLNHTETIKLPLGFFLAGDDRVVSTQASEAFFREHQKPEDFLKVYPHLFHEILNETKRDEVMNDMLDFIRSCA